MSVENGNSTDTGAGRPAAMAEHDKDSPAASKRKASSPPPENASSKSPKRTKLDDAAERGGSTGSPPPASKGQTTDRRQTSKEEERKRGKRLFGGLLSTLSQTTTSSQQKKRQEIERRQQAKVHQKRAEDDRHREEKLAKLLAVRKREQLKFDEQVMQTRHSQMLATARFLQTKTEPKIYYLPWDPTRDEEDTMKDQIRDAEDAIEREVREFKQRKERRMKALGIPIESSAPEPAHSESDPAHTSEPTPEELEQIVGKKPDDAEPQPLNKTESTNPVSTTHTTKAGSEKDLDEAGDVMVEDEDTVIY